MSKGARINQRNKDEKTPLHLATENGKVRYGLASLFLYVYFSSQK